MRADVTEASARRMVWTLAELVMESLADGERCALPGLGEFKTMRWRMSARKNACGDLPEMVMWRLYFRATPTARKRLNNALARHERKR